MTFHIAAQPSCNTVQSVHEKREREGLDFRMLFQRASKAYVLNTSVYESILYLCYENESAGFIRSHKELSSDFTWRH